MSTSEVQATELLDWTCGRCQKPAKLQCPRCLELNLEKAFSVFCSQECFKVRPQHRFTYVSFKMGWFICDPMHVIRYGFG